MPLPEALQRGYEEVKASSRKSARSHDTANAIHDLAVDALRFLADECYAMPLNSQVEGKEYEAFVHERVTSRPVNTSLFVAEAEAFDEMWQQWRAGGLGEDERTKLFYTAGLTPGLAMELFNRQNRKGPATYFESLVGFIFADMLGVNPQRHETLSINGRQVRLTMDFIFRPEVGERVHLAVKMSTRERVVQAWAHQHLLAAAFAKEAYRGILVAFAETKMDSVSREVVEICVPDQWLAYQRFLARMDTIYYFDPPERYIRLARDYPEDVNLQAIGELGS